MSLEKSDALLIRQADFSESSRVVTFFTREFGRVPMVAKGGKRLKGPFEAALDLLAESRIVFIRKSTGGLDILTEAQLKSRFRPRERSLASLYGGYYVAELLDGLTEDYDPHLVLYDEAVLALKRFVEDPDPKPAVLRFELVTLREIGQFPDLDACISCGNRIAGQQQFAFWVSQGGLLCPTCQKQEYQSHRIAAGTIAVLNKLAHEPPAVAQRLIPSPQQFKEMRSIVTAAISHALGRRPKLLRYILH